MYPEPLQNDPSDPLVSLLVFNYEGKLLRTCLDSIFTQQALQNFEVILIDDASNDGAWDVAAEYADKYSRSITISRNKRALGPARNRKRGRRLAKGRYYATLTGEQRFLPDYVARSVKIMELDPYATFRQVKRLAKTRVPAPIHAGPLVSVLCYNYNYGRYLRQCLASVFAQTYENVEVCFSDNASTDDSWPIALHFARKYPGRMHITRNRKNFGPDANFANCSRVAAGKYHVALCSDDALAPEYVERCVTALEAHPHTAMAIVNRAIVDEQDRRREEPPFYNQSCVVRGAEQAAVYMMAGVNPSISQVMYRRDVVPTRSVVGGLAARYYGTRILDFNISMDFDIVYLSEPLLLHRIHAESDAHRADGSLLPVMGIYVLNHQFAELAAVRDLTKITARFGPSLVKLSHLAVRYCVRSLLANDADTALKYLHLAMAISPEIAGDRTWKQVQEWWTADDSRRAAILDQLRSSDNLATRSISYDPPPGSVPL